MKYDSNDLTEDDALCLLSDILNAKLTHEFNTV